MPLWNEIAPRSISCCHGHPLHRIPAEMAEGKFFPPYLKPDPARAARLAEQATAAAIKAEIRPEEISDEIEGLPTNCSKCSFLATSSGRIYSDHFDTGNP